MICGSCDSNSKKSDKEEKCEYKCNKCGETSCEAGECCGTKKEKVGACSSDK